MTGIGGCADSDALGGSGPRAGVTAGGWAAYAAMEATGGLWAGAGRRPTWEKDSDMVTSMAPQMRKEVEEDAA
jgi:DNA-binding protein H-NS